MRLPPRDLVILQHPTEEALKPRNVPRRSRAPQVAPDAASCGAAGPRMGAQTVGARTDGQEVADGRPSRTDDRGLVKIDRF